MKIAIESFWLNTDKLTGVGYYQLNIIRAILKMVSDIEFYLLYTGQRWIGPDLGDRCIPISYGVGRVNYLVNFKLHKIIKKLNPDIYHAVFPTRVPLQKLPCPIITTVHDLLPLHIESFYKKLMFNITTYFAWKKSSHFLCNSQYTANEIYKYKNIPTEKTTVTYLAPAFKVPEWNRNNKHILFVGSLSDRKRPVFLLEIYKELSNIMGTPPMLIFVGDDRDGNGELILKYNRDIKNGCVKWLKYVSEEELNGLYSDSALFILPSKLEGFGMPVIEAMSGGIPTACSDIEVFKEIVGGGAEIISGLNKKVWAKKIKTLLESSEELNRLSIEGKKRAAKFNWTNCAKQTLQCYQKLNTNEY